MIRAYGQRAFTVDLTPRIFMEAANYARTHYANEEAAQHFEGLAHDLATIRNLPETPERS